MQAAVQMGSGKFVTPNCEWVMINSAKKMNNCSAARKCSVVEVSVQRWREQKQKLMNMRSTWKSSGSEA